MSKKGNNPYKGSPLLGQRPKHHLTPEDVAERMRALFEHHGIIEPEHDPQAVAKLAYCLAKTFVPGFQPTRPAGRPKERTPLELALFLMQFCQTQRETNIITEKTTLKRMADDPWWVQNGFDHDKEKVFQAMCNAMQELQKPQITEQVAAEIDGLMAASLEMLRGSPEKQRRLRKKMGGDSPE